MENIESTIKQFRKAILEKNTSVLNELLSQNLSYGHSDGHLEGKSDFITKIADGTYSFLTMELSRQSISETGNVAVVRHELDAKTNDEGKAGEAHLYVLLVWYRFENEWKLIARQAVKKL